MFNSTKKSLSGVEFARRKSSDRIFSKTMTAKRFPSMVAVAMPSDLLAPQVHELGVKGLYFQQALHAIYRLLQSLLCVKCFLDASYRNLATEITWPPRSIWHRQIFFVGLPQKQGLYQSSTVSRCSESQHTGRTQIAKPEETDFEQNLL